MDFVAIDVETANADQSSICQIGIAEFRNGVCANTWKTYVNPETDFDEFNIDIQGITPEMVKDAPTFLQLKLPLYRYLKNKVVVCHTLFDQKAIHKAAQMYDIQIPECQWLDSHYVAKKTWFDQLNSFGLKNVSEFLGFNFQHHDALEDAKAAGNIIIEASKKTGKNLNDFLIDKPKKASYPKVVKKEANSEGILFGEVIVFTGELSLSREQAANIAAHIGCKVDANITKKTTMLVVGTQNPDLIVSEKSSKHLKAEEYIKKGQNIKILLEQDFFEIIEISIN